MKTLTITLGETDYEIKEFTLGTQENIQEVVLGETPGLDKDPKAEFTRNILILSAALVQDHPDLVPETLRKKRCGGTIQSVAKAVHDVMVFAGYAVTPRVAQDGAATAPATGAKGSAGEG